MYRVVIADDEPLARRGVRARLRHQPDFVVERECRSGNEALAAIRSLRPDLVFLDIQMPGLSGLDVAQAIAAEPSPAVIFTTAFDAYAVGAFDVHAVDYLLKPLDDAKFARAIDRARRVIDNQTARGATPGGAKASRREPALDRFCVKTCGRIVFVPVRDVDWIAAEGDYARLYADGRSYLIDESLTSLEPRLSAAGFVRIHRSSIVNLARVGELRARLNQDHVVRLQNGVELRLSRTYYRRFIDRVR